MIKQRTMLILVAIFLLLAGTAYLLDSSQRANQGQVQLPTAQPEVFSGVQPTQITRIVLENHATGRQVTLVRVPGGWQGTDKNGKPVQVDPGQPPRMLQILSTLRYNRVMEGSDVKAFGLANGGMFSVSFDAGRSYTLLIGDLNSDSSLAFVQRGIGSAIVQVPAQPMVTLLAPVMGTQ
jgi:hypothetical protein